MSEAENPATVYLAGAGPGDPELLTRKTHRLLRDADVVCYDALVAEDIIDIVPPETRTVDVGKRPGPDGERTTQAAINRLLVDHARAGETVLRLKGGDPTVFARGGEEAAFLEDAGVPHEFVPGVSSVVGAPESAGIPLTHRDHASSLTVVTGTQTPAKETTSLDWDAVARNVVAGGTLVILMGVGRLPEITAGLHEAGVPSETPAATIQEATLDTERVVTGTVGTIGCRIREADIEPPATTVVGDVVASSEGTVAELSGTTRSGELPSVLGNSNGIGPDSPRADPLSTSTSGTWQRHD